MEIQFPATLTDIRSATATAGILRGLSLYYSALWVVVLNFQASPHQYGGALSLPGPVVIFPGPATGPAQELVLPQRAEQRC